MAKNNSLETPLSMPKLPDLDQDLFGAGAIFNQSDDLLNPKAVAPPGAQQGKLSPAAQALASAQREQNDLLNSRRKSSNRKPASRQRSTASRQHSAGKPMRLSASISGTKRSARRR